MPTRTAYLRRMRAAEILVEVLLDEAGKAIAIAFGPGIRDEGSYFEENSDRALYNAIAAQIGGLANTRLTLAGLIDLWLYRGYTFITRTSSGEYRLYGSRPIQVSDKINFMLNVQPETPVSFATRDGEGGLTWQNGTASTMLGVRHASASAPAQAAPKAQPKKIYQPRLTAKQVAAARAAYQQKSDELAFDAEVRRRNPATGYGATLATTAQKPQ